SLVRAIGGAVSGGLPVGFGLNASGRSTMEAIDSTIVDAKEIGVATSEAGTRVTLDKVLVSKTPLAIPAEFGHGLLAAFGSVIDARGSIVDAQTGVGLFYAGGRGTITRSLVRRNAIGAHV